MVKTRRRSAYGPPGPPGAKKKRKPNKAASVFDSLQTIVKILTENECIGAKELGLLEQTCKNARSGICTEEVWEALCLRTWPNTRHLKSGFLGKAGGYRAWYILRRPARTMSQPREPLPPPRRNANDIIFFVDIKAGNSPIMSTILAGGRHLKLDVEGSIINRDGCVHFRQIKNVGGAEHVLGETKDILCATWKRSEAFTVEVQMTINERPGNRICPIMHPDAGEFCFRKQAIAAAYDGGDDYVHSNFIHHSRWTPPCKIRSSVLGCAIQQRLGNSFALRVSPLARFTNDRTKVVIDSIRFDILVDHAPFKKEKQQETGVSILHILEELEGQPCENAVPASPYWKNSMTKLLHVLETE